MALDMALATSYKPVLVCIAKVCVLMAFHYASVMLLFVTERYAAIVALLYLDQWLAHEYILNTNSCVAVLAGSLLVHELRDAGVQERLHGVAVHNVVLALLVMSNLLVLVLGDSPPGSWASVVAPSGGGGGEEGEDTGVLKKLKLANANHPRSSVCWRSGPLLAVLCTSCLLVLLSTCSLPVSPHDPLLNNGRVWAFVALSLTWMYTVNCRELRYCSVAAFTPCVLRFSSVLFLTPAPVAFAGVALMAAGLGGVTALPPRAPTCESWEEGGGGGSGHNNNNNNGHNGNNSSNSTSSSSGAPARRLRDASGGSGISYRAAAAAVGAPPAPAAAKLDGGGLGAPAGVEAAGGAHYQQHHQHQQHPQHPHQQHPPPPPQPQRHHSSSTGSTTSSSSHHHHPSHAVGAAYAAAAAAAAAAASSSGSALGSVTMDAPADAHIRAGGSEGADDAEGMGIDALGAEVDYNTLFEETLNAQLL